LPPELITLPRLAAEEAEAATAVEFAMNLLSEQDRDLLHRVHFDGQQLADVARSLEVSESAIKMRLFRARRSLAARLVAWPGRPDWKASAPTRDPRQGARRPDVHAAPSTAGLSPAEGVRRGRGQRVVDRLDGCGARRRRRD
jgi:hypothetical protein